MTDRQIIFSAPMVLSLHGLDSWDANPEVVALTFTVYKVNIDKMGTAA